MKEIINGSKLSGPKSLSAWSLLSKVYRIGQIVLHGSVNWVAMFLTDIRSKNKAKRVMILVNFNLEQYWTMELTETINVTHISKGLQAYHFWAW